MTARRIVSIWLPHFAIQRWRRRHYGEKATAETEPVVLARPGTHGPVIHDMNAAAAALGMARGARVTDMRTLVPDLRVEDAEERLDHADLARLSHWCRRWCPWTRSDGADGLMLDTTGADHLWGGEAALIADMRRAFAQLGLTAHIAIAPTVGSAWAFARHGQEKVVICPPDRLAERLGALPVAALRLDGNTVLLLERLGFRTIAALAEVPRAAMARRFRHGTPLPANPLARLDQAMGRTTEPLVAAAITEPLRSLRTLAEPITEIDSFSHVLDHLMQDLAIQMEAHNIGARCLRFSGFRVDGGVSAIQVATSRPSREPGHLAKLFENRIETLDPGFGFEAMVLDVIDSQDLALTQPDLSGETDTGVALSRLIDRLIARLGRQSVLRPLGHGSHVPERAEVLVPADTAMPGPARATTAEALESPAPHRPLRLLPRPEEVEVLHAIPDGPPARFIWRRQTHRVVRSGGPERIAPEWWREKSIVRLRDYYNVEDSDGRRYWIYREGVAGDGRGGNPHWFMHGLDA